MEWIIIDDGTDAIKDLVENVEGVKYYYFDKKMLLGEKRNLTHKYAKGEILVYMDDDDYYPPESLKTRVMDLIWSKFITSTIILTSIRRCLYCHRTL